MNDGGISTTGRNTPSVAGLETCVETQTSARAPTIAAACATESGTGNIGVDASRYRRICQAPSSNRPRRNTIPAANTANTIHDHDQIADARTAGAASPPE